MVAKTDMEPPVPNLAELVATIRVTPLGKLDEAQCSDVVEILGHIRTHTLAAYDQLQAVKTKLEADRKALEVAQSAFTLRQRVQEAREATLRLIPIPEAKRPWWRPW